MAGTGDPLAYRGGSLADTGNPLANTKGPMTDTSGPLTDMEGPTSDSGGPLADTESIWLKRRQEAYWTGQDTLWPTQIALARCRRSSADT